MKIKESILKEIIKEEIELFKENYGGAPFNETLRNDMRQMFERLLANIGAERFLEEIVKRIDPKALRVVLETLVKLHDIRYQEEQLQKEGGYDDYDDASVAEITPIQAKKEIEKHGLEWADFVKDVGLKPSYVGSEVLDWLGY